MQSGNKKSNHVSPLYARPFDFQTSEILKLFLILEAIVHGEVT